MSKADKILKKMRENPKPQDYPIEIRPIPPEEGGGYLALFPDLPGCIADGETPEEAIRNALDAAESWLKTAREFGDPIPTPFESSDNDWLSYAPRNLYMRLADRAQQEGVSVSELAVEYLAEGLRRRTPQH